MNGPSITWSSRSISPKAANRVDVEQQQIRILDFSNRQIALVKRRCGLNHSLLQSKLVTLASAQPEGSLLLAAMPGLESSSCQSGE